MTESVEPLDIRVLSRQVTAEETAAVTAVLVASLSAARAATPPPTASGRAWQRSGWPEEMRHATHRAWH